jgi:OOP family OmpA-OmpF porin
MIPRVLSILLIPSWVHGANALDLPGNARLTAERGADLDSYALPTGPFVDGIVPSVEMEGTVRREAWVIGSSGVTPLQVLRPLRDQLIADGYRIVLDCADAACGGFDFRFGIEVLPAPNMYVNISSYRFVSAVVGPNEEPDKAVTLLVSSTRDAAYVQVITVGSEGTVPQTTTEGQSTDVATLPPVKVEGGAFDISDLVTQGSVVLDGVAFQSGSTALGEGPFERIETLAGYLKENPGLKIALVGHTDSVGGLDANIAVSRKRAQSVRQRLIDEYGIAGARMEAQGMGYLAPRASNLTPSGREANRRVEAILLSAE